jgi:hypothetical protein
MVYHAQIEYLDDQIGNLTAAFKATGLWNTTLMILHAGEWITFDVGLGFCLCARVCAGVPDYD